MKKLLLSISLIAINLLSNAQPCSVSVNDSLYTPSFNYSLNATNTVGIPPFLYTWTVSSSTGMPITPIYTSPAGDSILISQQDLANSYGCVIYQLCMTDGTGCTTCAADTGLTNGVPFNCFSQFQSSITGPNQITAQLTNNVPPFLIAGGVQFQWTNGDGTPGNTFTPNNNPVQINYIPGAQNTSNKFFVCALMQLSTGGCVFCDSILFTNSGLGLTNFEEINCSIYPNPSEGKVTLKVNSLMEKLFVYNAEGKLIVEKTVDSTESELQFSAEQKGMFIIEIHTALGIHRERLLIK